MINVQSSAQIKRSGSFYGQCRRLFRVYSIAFALLVLLGGCSGEHHLRKAMKKDPYLFKNDTVLVVLPPVTIQSSLDKTNIDSILNAEFELYTQLCDELTNEAYLHGRLEGEQLTKEQVDKQESSKKVIRKAIKGCFPYDLPHSDTIKGVAVNIAKNGSIEVECPERDTSVVCQTVVNPDINEAKKILNGKYFLIPKALFWVIGILKILILIAFLYFSGKLKWLTNLISQF